MLARHWKVISLLSVFGGCVIRWNDHEFLESKTATGVRATVQNVREWHGQDIWLLGTGKI